VLGQVVVEVGELLLGLDRADHISSLEVPDDTTVLETAGFFTRSAFGFFGNLDQGNRFFDFRSDRGWVTFRFQMCSLMYFQKFGNLPVRPELIFNYEYNEEDRSGQAKMTGRDSARKNLKENESGHRTRQRQGHLQHSAAH
jgi:hypothetical protein